MTVDFLQMVLAASVVLLAFLAVMGVVLTLFNWNKMRKQKDYYEKVHESLAPGKRVMFAGGLMGTLVRVGKETCDVELKSGAIVEVSRYAIQEIVTK